LGPEFKACSSTAAGAHLQSLDGRRLAPVQRSQHQLSGSVTVNKVRSTISSAERCWPARTYRLSSSVTREFVVSQERCSTRHAYLDAAFDIKRGTSSIRFPAGTDNRDITVICAHSGHVAVPKLTLESEQKVQVQTELISYLMFGKTDVRAGSAREGLCATRPRLLAGERSAPSYPISACRSITSRSGPAIRPIRSPAAGRRGWAIGSKTSWVVNAGFCQQVQSQKPIATDEHAGRELPVPLQPEWRTEASFEPVRACGLGPVAGARSRQSLRRVLGATATEMTARC